MPAWFFVALVTAAIGLSYFHRQELPIAISAIERTIPVSMQYASLQAAFLATYALLYSAGGGFLSFVLERKPTHLIPTCMVK